MAMTTYLVERSDADLQAIHEKGDHLDSRRAAWFAIGRGSEVIADIQRVSPQHKEWKSLKEAYPFLNDHARTILDMRLAALHKFKQAPHHRNGFRLSGYTRAAKPRPVNALCLISGHEGQEIPGLVAFDRVVVDAEHMEQALGPATITEIFKIRKAIGENVYISTNVSETPQIVRNLLTGDVDTRATAALTAAKVIAALDAGADVVKVGFANLDPFKRDLGRQEIVKQMQLVRGYVDEAVAERAIVMPLTTTGQYPLVSVFFPEIGVDSHGERPVEIAATGIELSHEGGWQGVLIDTFVKHTGRRYKDFYSVEETARLAARAHEKGLEFWIAGSITRPEVAALIQAKVDLICFGGAARHETGARTVGSDESIKRPLVEALVAEFERADPRQG